jgi:nitrogen regulatory protein P-II 1
MMELQLITCIVQRGEADRIVKVALDGGAQGATVFYARGTGVRQKLGLMGALITPEKEVVLVVSHADKVEGIFNAIVKAGRLDEPGKGFAFTQKVEKVVGFLEAS